MSAHTFHNIGLIRGHFEYLSTFNDDVMNEQRVVASLRAVALAAYATKFQHVALLKKARQYYVAALRHINAALLSCREAAKNATIISILFLNTFEALTLTCLMRSFRIPMGLVKLHRHTAAYMDTDDPAWKLSDIMISLSYFRAHINCRTLYDPEKMIACAKDMDRSLCSLTDNMPVDWQFQVVNSAKTSKQVMGTQFHKYPDAWVAGVWNNIRTCRLLLHQEIKQQMENVGTSLFDAVQYQHSVIIMQQLVSDICASVPQYCGYLPVISGSLSDTQTDGNGIPAIAGIYLLFWPLLYAGQMASSECQRDWIIDRMRYIGETTGIQQAFVFEDILKRGVDPFQ
ncbi:hypothetical protein AtubIFM55763_007297 [Aspergillus tubingensis]|nr:hypothetical protein AtubIFM54640_002619 [Aspergillus tubingensis]GLA75743.1 hypothetical protein AtubIFM55763_007297 [Aspergillus tubingensis]GLB23237.1 hypothetical protein AtubIFM61612_003826 [Aspergillus tubingensis]